MNKNIDDLIALLRVVPEHRFNMGNSCGAVCCIGGWAVTLVGLPGEDAEDTYDRLSRSPNEALPIVQAMGDLGFPLHDADMICYPPSSGRAGVSYYTSKLYQVIDLLEHYKATGVVDWERTIEVSA